MAEGNSAPESTPQVNPESPEVKTSQGTGRGSISEVNASKAVKPPAPEVTAVKPEQENSPQRQLVRGYLNSGASRIGNTAEQLGPWLINPANRQIFIEEWARAVASAENFEQLESVNNLAWDPHQFGGFLHHIRSQILAARPELEGSKYNFPVLANFPEYDGIRKAVGEKLKTLGLTKSGIKGESSSKLGIIFHLLHPNPYEEYTYTTTKIEARGKLFKKQVRVPVEERGKRFSPYEQLMAELLQYNQPQSAPAAPPKA